MKKIIASLLFATIISGAFAQTYTATDNGSAVKFTIKNFGLNVTGTFKELKGKIIFNSGNLASSYINASATAATVNTGIASRDSHLKKEEYFDVAKYPLISFAADKIIAGTKPGSYIADGRLTIKGVSKSISFPFTATAKTEGYLFEGELKLNRRDFGIGGKSLVLSDNLTVFLSVLGKKN